MMMTDARDFGLSEASADNADAFDAAIEAAWTNGTRAVWLPAGSFRISRQIDTSGVHVHGVGPVLGTEVVVTEFDVNAFVLGGHRNGQPAPGGGVHNLKIGSASGITAGVAIFARGTDQFQPDRLHLSHLRITVEGLADEPEGAPTGFWKQGIYINGADRSTPQGVRGGLIHDVEVFNCTTRALTFWSCNGMRFDHVRAIPGAGSGAAAGMVTGGATGIPCRNLVGTALHFSGDVIIQNTLQSRIEGIFNKVPTVSSTSKIDIVRRVQ